MMSYSCIDYIPETDMKSKVVLSMHDGHIASAFDESTGPYSGIYLLGTQLQSAFGDNYVPIALAGYDVYTHWPVCPWQPIPTDADSIELMLHNLGSPYLLLDPNSSFLTPETQFEMALNSVTVKLIPASNYKAIFFLDSSPE